MVNRIWSVISGISVLLSIAAFVLQYGPKVRDTGGQMLLNYHPNAVGALTVASLLLSSVSIYLWTRRGKKRPNVRAWYSTTLERVVGKTFMNQIVEIDGKNFEHCNFVNAQLLFHGLGPYRFEDCEFGAGVLVNTDNAAAMGMMRLQHLMQLDPAHGRVQLLGIDQHGRPTAIGPQLAPAPTDLPSQEKPRRKALGSGERGAPSIPDPPLRIVAKIRNVDPFTDRGGHKIEIEVDLFPARPIVQVAWFKLEWTDGMISGEGTGLDPIKTPGPLRLTSEESWPVTFHVAPPMRARGRGRIVAKANNEEVRSEWFEMNPTRR